jgi:hypothetical protein
MVTMKETAMTARPNILLVHGAWADGSSWDAVIERLQADGYNVIAPQFPETSLAADVDRLRQVLAWSTSPRSAWTKASRSAACWPRANRRRPWPIWTSTSRASPGYRKTTS